MQVRALTILALSLGCSRARPVPPVDPSAAAAESYYEAEARLESTFLDQGMVVSRGKTENLGDSLIWSGVGLGSEDCAHSGLRDGLYSLVKGTGGRLARHSSTPDAVSLDGALGYYYGVANRLVRCPSEAGQWHDTLSLQKDYMDAHGGQINVGYLMPGNFDFVQKAVMAKVGLSTAPSDDSLKGLAIEATAWTTAVKLQKAACYRVHISWLALRTAEILGYSPPRDGFCAASNSLGLAVVDHWCGRGGLDDFMSGFVYNKWQYKHQRCQDWETPDGDGDEQPAVDYLIGYTELYNK